MKEPIKWIVVIVVVLIPLWLFRKTIGKGINVIWKAISSADTKCHDKIVAWEKKKKEEVKE